MFTSEMPTGPITLSNVRHWLGIVVAGVILAGVLGSVQPATAQQSVFKEAKQKYQFAE